LEVKSYREDNRPSLQFYPDDWLSEPGLNICSLAAQGLWIKMISIMWKADIRGCLKANGKQINSKGLAKLSGVSEEEISKLLKELGDNNVYSTLEDGTIYSRRLYREAYKERELREARTEAGRLGGLAKGKQTPSKLHSKKVAKQPSPSSTPSPSPSPPSPSKTKTFSLNSTEFKLSKLLFDLIRKRKPNFREPDFQKWAVHIDKLIRIDKRTPEQVEVVIHWCQSDTFWRNNILSTQKLREQIDQLELKMRSQKESVEDKLREKAKNCSQYAGRGVCIYEAQGVIEEFCKYCSRYMEKQKKEGGEKGEGRR